MPTRSTMQAQPADSYEALARALDAHTQELIRQNDRLAALEDVGSTERIREHARCRVREQRARMQAEREASENILLLGTLLIAGGLAGAATVHPRDPKVVAGQARELAQACIDEVAQAQQAHAANGRG